MVNFDKIFAMEKKIALEILAMEHKAIVFENRYVLDFRQDLRQFFSTELFRQKIDNGMQAKIMLETASRQWGEKLEFYQANFRFYLTSQIFFIQKNTQAILSKYFSMLYTLTESIEDYPGSEDTLKDIESEIVQRFLLRRWTSDQKTWKERITQMAGPIAQARFARIFAKGMKEGRGYHEMLREAKKIIALDAVKLEKIIRTEGQRIQNDILLYTYDRNKRFLSGLEYTATLDTRTCTTCGAFDGQQFFYGNLPGQKNIENAPRIPIHPLCRCLYVPITKSWEGLGQDFPRLRASQYGPTTGTYSDWLKSMEGRTPGFARPILRSNYDSWIAGTWQLNPSTIRFEPQSTIADFLRDR